MALGGADLLDEQMTPTNDPDDTDEVADSTSLGRRGFVAAAASGFAGLSGCLNRMTATLDRDAPRPLSVTIKTLPTDADPRAIRIARELATNLEAVGITSEVVPMARQALFRDVLVGQQFDLYVARHPERASPDFLRPLFHSQFNVEAGWQNPYGYANIETDELLERQRRQRGARRRSTLADAARTVVRDQPMTVVAFADETRLVRTDRFEGWRTDGVHSLLGYLSLSAPDRRTDTDTLRRLRDPGGTPVIDSGTDRQPSRLRMAVTDRRMTKNLNPLSVEYRNDGTVTRLLYDSLGQRIDGRIHPWAASGWEWVGVPDASRPAVRVRLREGMTWHDGTALTPDDVAFTYRLLRDTLLGQSERPAPAPRFRGQSSLVDRVVTVDDRHVRVEFEACSRPVARRALTVPILPEHVWAERAALVEDTSSGGGVPLSRALVSANLDPIGSGPFRFVDVGRDSQLVLEPFPDHFLGAGDEALPDQLDDYGFPLPFDALEFRVVPAAPAAVDLVRDGTVDATATPTMGAEPPPSPTEPLECHEERSSAFYHVGYNVRRAPLSNTRFRRAVARLVDRSTLVEEAMDGRGMPSANPLARSVASENRLDTELSFVGNDGELSVDRARELFRAAGYQYDDQNRLVGR